MGIGHIFSLATGTDLVQVDYFGKKRVLEIQRENMIKEAQARGANILSASDVKHPAGRRDGT